MDAWREFFNLLVPSTCVSCKNSGWSLCDECLQRLGLSLRPVSRENLGGFCLTSYSPAVAEQVTAFKEQGVTELATLWLRNVDLTGLREEFSFDHLVPLPSSVASNRARGFSPADEVARALLARLRATHLHDLRLSRVLSRESGTADQASLGVSQRWLNMAHKIFARGKLDGQRVLLVDDIVTTGASLLEAARALEQVGATAAGFFCIAETLLREQTDFQKLGAER